MELVCFWETLMEYAYELGQARLSKDQNRIDEATKKHEAYRDMCLKADRMIIPNTMVERS